MISCKTLASNSTSKICLKSFCTQLSKAAEIIIIIFTSFNTVSNQPKLLLNIYIYIYIYTN